MIGNYFKIAWRGLMKHKLFSFINIFGLASAMTVCMLALIKIKDAFDYDRFHPNSDRTYRIITDYTSHPGEPAILLASSPLPLGQYLKDNYPVIDKTTRIRFLKGDVTGNYKTLFANGVLADENFYRVFGFRIASGHPAISPRTIVLTEKTAKLFFGEKNPIGQTMTIDDAGDFIVAGIFEKAPYPSHLQFDFIASMSTMPLLNERHLLSDWSDEAAAYTYVQLKAEGSSKELNTILVEATKKVNAFFLSSVGKKYSFQFQSLDKISPSIKPIYNTTAEPALPGLIGFGLLGTVMLLLAFFNYVNLTLARSLDRAREVGIRKVMGALKYHLTLQFLVESVLIAVLSLGLAEVLLKLISRQPTVYRLIAEVHQDGKLWLYFLVFALFTGLMAGWIPAKVFAGFQPERVLKGKFNTKLVGAIGLRKTLTVVQFTASLVALVTLLVFYHQARYMATADYGFARKHMLNIPIQGQSYEKLASAFSQITGVESVAASSEIFGFSTGDHRFIRRYKDEDSLASVFFSVTPSFLNNMEITRIAGNNIPATTSASDRNSVVINEEASHQLQFKNPAEAIGQQIWLNDTTQYRIAGVVKNFHFASFLRSIQPLILANQPEQFKMLNIKVAASAEQTIIPKLENAWEKINPHQSFEARWFDKELYQQHLNKDDLVFIALLTGIALAIACLGLLGMVIHTANNRSKEVSIRRVLGAKLWHVVLVVSKGFIWLLLMAVCIGLPLGFFAGQKFLQQYAYRISIGPGILISSAIGLLLLGGITIMAYTFRTALANPVKSLRNE